MLVSLHQLGCLISLLILDIVNIHHLQQLAFHSSIRAHVGFAPSVRAHSSSSSPSVGAHVGSTPPHGAFHTTTLDFEHVKHSPLGTSSLSPLGFKHLTLQHIENMVSCLVMLKMHQMVDTN
ncbi:hypothetical protein VNO78_02613 [Psophocarpus tetragonolobus]|uniref:Uncharacterized protein n=1 Tax=Psophocarpus tetragonolobus TaxID=3891 RepID=A0AAN9XV66_PSOTE